MFTTGATTSCGARDHVICRSPFTPTQWQELEHQVLMFKCMVSGVPIPVELIYAVKRSLDSSLASTFFPTQHVGWGGFQVGFGRKADPEPGRCRRTDGKKWRCSKEAYRDSKYCERHMNRGRNRKHMEALTSSSATAMSSSSSSTATNPSSISPLNRKLSINTPSSSISSPSSYSFSPLSSSISPELYAHQETTQKSSKHFNPFLYPYSSSSSRHPGSYGSCSQTDKDYSYNFHGIREGAVDERAFFPEVSGKLRSFQDSCHPYGSYNEAYSHHSPVKNEKEDEIQKPLHHFFGGWPPKNTE